MNEDIDIRKIDNNKEKEKREEKKDWNSIIAICENCLDSFDRSSDLKVAKK